MIFLQYTHEILLKKDAIRYAMCIVHRALILRVPVLTVDPIHEDEVSFTFLTFSDKFSRIYKLEHSQTSLKFLPFLRFKIMFLFKWRNDQKQLMTPDNTSPITVFYNNFNIS